MKQATILNNTIVFETPDKEGRALISLEKGNYVNYVKEKYKNGIVWLEIILQNNSKGYIDSKKAFKWERSKVLGNSVTFYPDNIKDEGKNYVILQGGEIINKILPPEKDTKNNLFSKVIDSKDRIGIIKDKYIYKTGVDLILKIVAIFFAIAISIGVAIYAVIFMILGGKLFFGSIVIVAFIFLGKVFFLLIYSGFQFIRQAIYNFIIRF